MGLLDEAIREHLELKRRRGADPTEVEREEREALGPVRRMADEGSGGDAPASAAGEAQSPVAPPPEPEVFEEAHGVDEAPWFEDAPGLEDEGPEDDHPFEEDTAPHAVVAPPEPAPGGEAGQPDAAGASYDQAVAPGYDDDEGPETAEYDVEAEHREGEHAPAEAESDDMLEETPEFLQDAPEHDRLWFEQRPPRDFDFDG